MAAYHVISNNPERKALRQALIARREALTADERLQLTVTLNTHLLELLARLQPRTLGFCWPYRGEADILPAVTTWLAADSGRQAALPIVPEQPGPLRFYRWQPGAAMQQDRFGIPQPVEHVTLDTDLLLVPVNGFDAKGYRIGYGGGYFDRTLASLTPQPVTVGVGFELSRLESIEPQAHDRPLDWLVTEAGYWMRKET
ncbi:5-formyltetrahydrofolate cyclo-ligase [Uliginosibacterium gangwonense]|uniref:5-formyltetrahydrofolate cyclo-ligase n=1 Tax=Uliginosibacterium gangwonense TaxID=392736 RepID=UPI0003726F25|nr:5-formyltetrahydrofolate cyclo-ligase [Uliginosibacterium gangwonense]